MIIVTCLAELLILPILLSPIADIAVAFIYRRDVKWAWRGPITIEDRAMEVEERQLASSIILAQLGGVLTGASIIIAGLGAFVALSVKDLPIIATFSLFWAACWGVIAIGLAIYTLGILPSKTLKENVVKSSVIALFSAMALLFCLMAAARFLYAIAFFLFI